MFGIEDIVRKIEAKSDAVNAERRAADAALLAKIQETNRLLALLVVLLGGKA